MPSEKVLIDQIGGGAKRVILQLTELLQDDLFFCIQLLLSDFEMEKDLLLIAQGKI